MKLIALIPISLLASCASLAELVPGGGDLREHASVNLGQRIFSHSSANCIDEQDAIGVEYSVWREDGLFGYDVGLNYHRGSGDLPVYGDTTVEGLELNMGLRKTFPLSGTSLSPYIGLGVSGWTADREEENKTSRDGVESGLGVYERIGVTMPISKHAYIGVDLRFIQEDFLNKGHLNMDGDVISFVLGGVL